MTLEQFIQDGAAVARTYRYEDTTVLAADFGPEAPATVDVVDDTVIVVVEDDQYEFDLPEGADDAHTFIKNGILTVEMEAHR